MEIQISKLLIAIGFIIFQLYCNGQELPEKSTKNIKWDNNKLNIENKAIQLQFEKTLKGVELLRIKNKELDQIIQFDEGGSLFSLGNLTDSILSYDFNVKKIAETASSYKLP